MANYGLINYNSLSWIWWRMFMLAITLQTRTDGTRSSSLKLLELVRTSVSKDYPNSSRYNSFILCYCAGIDFYYAQFFEKALQKSSSPYFVGDSVTYVDISMYCLLNGIYHGYPKATARVCNHFQPFKSIISNLFAIFENIRSLRSASQVNIAYCTIAEHEGGTQVSSIV